MYSSQPSFQQYPTASENNPYADNLKTLKQVFSSPIVIGLIISIGISLIITLVNSISSMASQANTSSSAIISSEEQSFVAFASSISTVITFIILGILFLPFIGILMVYITSKNPSDSSSPKTGITILSVFSIISIVFWSVITLLLLFFAFAMSSLLSQIQNYSSPSSSANLITVSASAVMFIIGLFLIYSIVMIIWSASAFRFCLAIRQSLNFRGLFTNGAKTFRVCSIINSVFFTVLIFISIRSMFSSTGSLVNGISAFISVISILSTIATNVLLVILTSLYTGAVNKIAYTISYSGVNTYAGNTSNSTAYYQNTYQSPDMNTANPPYNTQNSFVSNYYQSPDINNQSNHYLNEQKGYNQQNINSQTTTYSSQQVSNTQTSPYSTQQPSNTQTNPYSTQQTSNAQTGTIFCPSCGFQNNSENTFCSECGTRLK